MRPPFSLAAVVATIFLLPAADGGALGADRKPMTPQDLWSVKRASNLAISPDGGRVAYQMTAWDLEAGTSNTDLWWSPTAGGSSQRLTFQPGRDAHPVWSTDGSSLFFLSARDENPSQVFELSVNGGEAVAVTDFPGGVNSFTLSGNGDRLLVSATSYGSCTDLECLESERAAREERKASGQVFESLLYRHWDSWRGDERSHVFLVKPGEDAKPLDLTPGAIDCPPVSLGSAHDFALSPDGRFAAVVVNRAPMVATSTDNDVEIIDLASGRRRVVSEGDANDNGPRFSPDGKRLAWMSMERPGYESDRQTIRATPIEGGKGSVFTQMKPDLSVSDFQFTPDGNGYVFTAQENGRKGLYLRSREGGDARRLVKGGRVGSFDVSADGESIVFALESLSTAPEIHRYNMSSGKVTRLTDHNETLLNRLELGRVEEMWFNGAGGDKVHAWIVHPPQSAVKTKGKVPVVWLVHGGPQGAWLDDQHPRWNMQQFAALGYYAIAVNFHGSSSYGQAFTDSINQDWGGKPFEDLMTGLDAARERLPQADLDRVCAAGGSYGGYMANWMLGHTGKRFRCFVSHAGVYDLRSMYGATEELWFPEWDLGGTFWTNPDSYERWSPSASAADFRTPTLVIHGQLDFRVPVTQGMQLFTALQRQGVPSKFLYYPDEGHWIQSPENAFLWWREIEAWFTKWLK